VQKPKPNLVAGLDQFLKKETILDGYVFGTHIAISGIMGRWLSKALFLHGSFKMVPDRGSKIFLDSVSPTGCRQG